MAKFLVISTVIFAMILNSSGSANAAKMVLAHGALNARIAPLWIAHEQKFFAKYGVESTVILVRQIQIMVSGLGTGEIDIALTSGSTLLGASAGGLDAKMVAALNGRVNYDLVAAPGIKTVKDLRGKRFGIQAFGGGLWMGAMLGLESLGLEPQRDQINVLQVGDQSVIAQALEAGSIDAAALDGVFSRRLKQKGFTILAEFSNANIPTIGLGLIAKTSLIRERQDSPRRDSQRAERIGGVYFKPKIQADGAQNHHATSADRRSGHGRGGLSGSGNRPRQETFPSVDGLRNTQRLLKPRNPKLENIKVEELIDDRIVRRLDESGFIGRLQATYGVK